jgi:hypothetical protein
VYEKAYRGFSQIIISLNDTSRVLNVEKIVFVPFSSNVINYNNMEIHGMSKINNLQNCKIFKKVEKIRYFGVIFDINLKRNLHINNLLGKLRFVTYKFVKVKNMVPKLQ